MAYFKASFFFLLQQLFVHKEQSREGWTNANGCKPEGMPININSLMI